MRCFLALRPDAPTRDRLGQIMERLRSWELPGRWTHPEDLHLTLCFLGECDPDEVAGMPYAIGEVAGGCVAPSLALPGLGAFAGKAEPRVVYAAVDDPEDACAGFHADFCEVLGQRSERSFQPHLTLCRPRPRRASGGRDWPELLAAFGQALWGPCVVDQLVLCESPRPTGSGPRYRILERWPLIDRGIAAVG